MVSFEIDFYSEIEMSAGIVHVECFKAKLCQDC